MDESYLKNQISEMVRCKVKVVDLADEICNKKNIPDEQKDTLKRMFVQCRKKGLSEEETLRRTQEIIDSYGKVDKESTNEPSKESVNAVGDKKETVPKEEEAKEKQEAEKNTDKEIKKTNVVPTTPNGNSVRKLISKFPTPNLPINDNTVYEADTNGLDGIVTHCFSISSGISGATIAIPGPMQKHAGGIEGALAGKSKITSVLNDFKREILRIAKGALEYDDISDASDIDWGDLRNIIYDRNKNSEMVEADENFFVKCGYEVKNGIASIEVDENGKKKKYEYNLSTKTLTIDGAGSIPVTIYYPKNATDLSKLNTYTYFTMKHTNESDKVKYDKYIDDPTMNGGNSEAFKGNAIVLKINKQDVSISKGNNMFLTEEGKALVPETTKFVNAVAGTKLKDNQCRNIIGGDSKFGAYSLCFAADNGDLYQTVYCVNNAFCVTGENIKGSNKTQITKEQLKNLAGKDIYMIYASGDDNQSHNGNWGDCSPKNSLAITGLDIMGEAMLEAEKEGLKPANVHVIYSNVGGKDLLVKEYKKMAEKYPGIITYNDEDEVVGNFIRKKYNNHSEGNWMIVELLEADVTNCNDFNHG